MKNNTFYRIVLFGLLAVFPFIMMAQQNTLRIKGSVKERYTQKPISGASIQIVGGNSTTTDFFGDFRINARIGDELRISHDSFRSVYYTIKDDQEIEVLVEDEDTKKGTKKRLAESSASVYEQNLKGARETLQKDAATSIDYITTALESVRDTDPDADTKKAQLYETLADIYRFWKQPDLAEDNYKISLKHTNNTSVKIKLARSQLENRNYQDALQNFDEIRELRLTKDQEIMVWEGLGDSYKGLNKETEALDMYNKALAHAQKEKKEAIIIELNSKIAEVLQVQGKISSAESYLDNSVKLASNKNKKIAARQRSKAADFYSKNNRYDKEIELRKEALEDIQEMELVRPAPVKTETFDSISPVENKERALTSQVQNYKIANAFAAQREYDEAITYLNESIEQASSENDLVVQKDATRKLGEVYREKGELKKASEAFEEYGLLVDKLHIQKEQDISQAALFKRQLEERAKRITTLEKDRELSESRYQLALASQELVHQQSLWQRVVIYSLVALTVLLLLAAYLMYRNIRQQRFANNLLALKSLRSQMNPHFIFNALNSVNTFIATSDERTANRYLTDFSLLMRAVLENSEEDFIPLEKEIELLELYIKLEHFRFQDKFEYEVKVDPEITVADYMIPPMLLQPYVENAVWHGLRYKEEKGLLSIIFEKLDRDSIQVIIRDNGIGRERSKALKTENQKKQQSKGMSNIKKRISILNTMYRDKIDVFVSDMPNPNEGTEVRVVLKKD